MYFRNPLQSFLHLSNCWQTWLLFWPFVFFASHNSVSRFLTILGITTLNDLYSARMSSVLKLMTATACICLLAMQMGGLHLHVDADGHDAGMHGTHLHQPAPSDHDHSHSAETDVSLLEEIGFSLSKLVPLILTCVIVLALIGWIQLKFRFPLKQTSNVRHRHRWRPPLRAPPIST